MTGPSTSTATPKSGRADWTQDELVVTVDRMDRVTGTASRLEAHGAHCVLHRAFMVLLVDRRGRILLCRRSGEKRLWPGVWADSCAGHPLPGEDISEAATRRVREELGSVVELAPVGRFVYEAYYGPEGCEHESCHVFVGYMNRVNPDPAEVMDIRLINPQRLESDLRDSPNAYAPWLHECLKAFPVEALLAALPE